MAVAAVHKHTTEDKRSSKAYPKQIWDCSRKIVVAQVYELQLQQHVPDLKQLHLA